MDWHQYWLVTNAIFWFHTSSMITYGIVNHYAVNFRVVFGQVATGGAAYHLQEQMACVHGPSLRRRSRSVLYRTGGIYSHSI